MKIDSLQSAVDAAQCWGSSEQPLPLGEGHIHGTYHLPEAGLVLQQVNGSVYRRPEQLLAQTQYVLTQLSQQTAYVERYQVPELMPSSQQQLHERVGDNLWRAWRFMPATCTLDATAGPAHLFAAAAAFGAYQNALQHVPQRALASTIDGFLELPVALAQFADLAATATQAQRDQIAKNEHLQELFMERNAVIHGDCKINNLLFHVDSMQVAAVIDLDTTMYAHWALDLGDLVRSVMFSHGRVDLSVYAACLAGFVSTRSLHGLGSADDWLQAFVFAPQHLTFMLAVRFLNDHLQGDVYFRVAERGENLRRAEVQFALFEEFVAQSAALRDVAEDKVEAILKKRG